MSVPRLDRKTCEFGIDIGFKQVVQLGQCRVHDVAQLVPSLLSMRRLGVGSGWVHETDGIGGCNGHMNREWIVRKVRVPRRRLGPWSAQGLPKQVMIPSSPGGAQRRVLQCSSLRRTVSDCGMRRARAGPICSRWHIGGGNLPTGRAARELLKFGRAGVRQVHAGH